MAKKLIREEFNSINEFIKTINNRSNNEVMKNENSSHDGSYDFTKTKSYSEAEELLKNGYTDILPKIKNEMKMKMKGSLAQKRIPYNDIVGFTPNVPNAIRGIPQSMINKTVIKTKSKTVNIIYSITENCNVGADEFIKCGTTMLNVINSLELNGIRVSFKIACFCAFEDHEETLCAIKVKDYRDQLDLRKLAFPIAHPSFFRRFGFKWLETVPNLKDNSWKYGYGHSRSITNYKDYPEFKDTKLIGLKEVKSMNYSYEEIIKSFNLN